MSVGAAIYYYDVTAILPHALRVVRNTAKLASLPGKLVASINIDRRQEKNYIHVGLQGLEADKLFVGPTALSAFLYGSIVNTAHGDLCHGLYIKSR